jgi:hypothetical protein
MKKNIKSKYQLIDIDWFYTLSTRWTSYELFKLADRRIGNKQVIFHKNKNITAEDVLKQFKSSGVIGAAKPHYQFTKNNKMILVESYFFRSQIERSTYIVNL